MKLTFLGTKANIDSTSKDHRLHSSLLVTHEDQRIMIDCGLDWKGKAEEVNPDILFITHAHPDHAFGLQDGAPCPVYATRKTWQRLQDYPLDVFNLVQSRQAMKVGSVTFEAFPVAHSTVAPAVGYKVQAGETCVFYVPDVAWIKDREKALDGVDVYIGDGAAVDQNKVRKMEDSLVGHTPIRTQLTWCQKEGVEMAFFTHCGSRIVNSDIKKIEPLVTAFADERQVDARIAYDGMEIDLQ